MPKPTRASERPLRCLRCGKRRPTATWQCADCAQSFADWDERDRIASVTVLEAHERALMRIADRLDGDGFWDAAKTVSRAAEVVMRLRDAVGSDAPWDERPRPTHERS